MIQVKTVFMDFGFRLQPLQVEQFAMGPVPATDSDVTVPKSSPQHAALFDAVCDREWCREVSIVLHTWLHAVVEFCDQGDEHVKAARYAAVVVTFLSVPLPFVQLDYLGIF